AGAADGGGVAGAAVLDGLGGDRRGDGPAGADGAQGEGDHSARHAERPLARGGGLVVQVGGQGIGEGNPGGAAGAGVGHRDGVVDGVALVGRGGPRDADRQVGVGTVVDDRAGDCVAVVGRVRVGVTGADGGRVVEAGPVAQAGGGGDHHAKGVGTA